MVDYDGKNEELEVWKLEDEQAKVVSNIKLFVNLIT